MSNIKALSQSVERELKLFKNKYVKGQSQYHQVKTISMFEKVESPSIHMSNMKALSQRVERKMKFFIFL